jgi:DNA polymerase III delta prime subunit
MEQQPDSRIPLEDEISSYILRLRQIDTILRGPVETLLRQAREAESLARESGSPQPLPRFPAWISDTETTPAPETDLTAGICLATLERFRTLRRRFPWLSKSWKEQGAAPVEYLSNLYLPKRGKGATPAEQDEADQKYFDHCCKLMDSRTFGRLNPITAAQVFRLLMLRGENAAHSGIGCLAFFAMVWPLYRTASRPPVRFGARIEPAEPSAYVTAKCVIPLLRLRDTCEHRAKLLRGLARRLVDLEAHSTRGERHHWTYCAELDALRHDVAEVADISILPAAFEALDGALGKEISELDADADLQQVQRRVREAVLRALQDLEKHARSIYADARVIHQQLGCQLVDLLADSDGLDKLRERQTSLPSDQRLRFVFASDEEPERYGEYLRELHRSAVRAHRLSRCILRHLRDSTRLDLASAAADVLAAALTRLADVNTAVGKTVTRPVRAQAEWCQMVVNREIAYASAHNVSDFDPAELVNAIVVSVRQGLLTTRLQVSDAVSKVLLGAQRDGSWRLGHPFFSPDGTLVVRPPASDIVWALTAAIQHHPEIRVADAALFNFLDWLERTQKRLQHTPPSRRSAPPPRTPGTIIPLPGVPVVGAAEGPAGEDGAAAAAPVLVHADEAAEPGASAAHETAPPAGGGPDPHASAAAPPAAPAYRPAPAEAAEREYDVGWSADRMRSPNRIHLTTTAYAINALLGIRDLVEHRLWELCERRFTVLEGSAGLKDMDPVDLMLPHYKRMHSTLTRMVRSTRIAAEDATYSMILHGPPGSSKTMVAGALAQEMWKGTRRWGKQGIRMIRVTPADFTRSGEDRVDFEAQLIFRLLSHVRGVTILFDEVDDLLRRRDLGPGHRPRFLDLVIPAMLNRLQDLRDDCVRQELCFVFGTNYIERIEPALMRHGRIDQKIAVVYPDYDSRCAIAIKALGSVPMPAGGDVTAWDAAVRKAAETVARDGAGEPWAKVRNAARNVRKAAEHRLCENKTDPSVVFNVHNLRPAAGGAATESDVEREYLRRLQERPDSRELHTEYLAYLVCWLCTPPTDGTDDGGGSRSLRTSATEQLEQHIRARRMQPRDLEEQLVRLVRGLPLVNASPAGVAEPARPPTGAAAPRAPAVT